MFIKLAKSAPLKPGVPRAMTSKSTFRSILTSLAWVFKISRRPPTSGFGTDTVLSKRPGRMSALSSIPGVFVAASTMTPSLALNPSISVNS